MSCNTCAVPTCVRDPNHTCFLLPKEHYSAKIWMTNCGIETNYVGTMICEAHFHKDMITSTKQLKKDAVPTLNLPPSMLNFPIPQGNSIPNVEAHFHKDIINPAAQPKRLKKDTALTLNLPPPKCNPSTPQGNSIPNVEIPRNTLTTVEKLNQIKNSNSMDNIIVMPLNIPLSQSNSPTDIMPLDIEPMELESSSNSSSTMIKELAKKIVKSLNAPSSDPLPTNIESLDIESMKVESSSNSSSAIVKELVDKIVKSLNAPSSEPNLRTDIKPLDIESMESSSKSFSAIAKEYITQHFGGRIVKPTVSQAVESSFSVQNKKERRVKSDIQTTRTEHALSSTQIESLASTNYVAETITEVQKRIQLLLKYPEILNMIAVKIYLTCPQGYNMLHSILKLPPVSELKTILNNWIISTDDGTMFASILQYKSKIMSVEQNDCILCVGTIDVNKYLHYDIKRDKLIGVCDINNIQKPEPAYKVLVVTVQGIYTDWKQPIDIAFISSPNHDNFSANSTEKLIEINIRNLLKIGFKVRAIVCETDYLLQTTSPNHEIYRRIYYMYDIMSLLKWFFYTFLTHDYIFEGERAKFEHIYDYFQLDSKNKPRLSPKISEEILKPASIQDVDAKNVMNVINMETAAAMTAYINMKVLKPATKNTVQMITKMSTLYEVLWSNQCNVSNERYTQVLNDMVSFFDGLKIVNSLTKKEVAPEDTFVPKFQITIKALLMLCKDMQRDGNAKALPTRRLSLENMKSFFDRIKQLKKENIKPTCKGVYLAFRQSAFLNVLRSTHAKKPVASLDAVLNEIKNIMGKTTLTQKVNTPDILYIKCSEYNTLNFKNKDSIVLLAGFLLKKCYDRHSDCDDMKNYTFIVLQDTSSICKTILEEIQESVCVVPQESFIEFVEMMEIRFRSFMTKDILESRNGFIDGLLRAMQSVTFPMPCSCFPVLYAKKLYLRVRINDMVKFNNSYLAAFPEQYKNLVVNNL